MRNTLLFFVLLVATLGISVAPSICAQAVDVTGVWLATDVPRLCIKGRKRERGGGEQNHSVLCLGEAIFMRAGLQAALFQ